MNWTHTPGTTEYILIAIFLTVYILFILRTFRIARKFGTKPRSLFIKFIHRILILGLMITALAGPYFGEVERVLLVLGRDIYFVVDVSRSMDATDVAPSRLEKVKYELNLLVQQLASNRVGLIAFSNDAFVQSPLTYDTESLQFLIQALDTRLLPGQGTHICSALQLAFDKMQTASDEKNSKIVVVFTDGEDGRSCSSELYDNLRRNDYVIFYVGVGTPNGSTIPAGDGPLKDEDGDIVISRLEEPALLKMAEETSSDYFQIGNDRVETEALMQAITQAQTHRIDTRTVGVANNKYYYFLAIALLLMTLDVLITFRTFRV